LTSCIIEVECRLEKKSEKIYEILRSIHTLKLGLCGLILLSLLSSLVIQLLISDLSHLLWIAVLDIKSILALEQNVSSKLFRNLALILLFEVDEGLLCSWNHDDSSHFSSLTSCRKIDLQLLFCGAKREVFDEEAKEHDGLLVFEVVHLKLLNSLCLLFCLFNVEIGKLDTSNFLDINVKFFSTLSSLVHSLNALNELSCFFSSSTFTKANESKTF
jgi:hypothetical protein